MGSACCDVANSGIVVIAGVRPAAVSITPCRSPGVTLMKMMTVWGSDFMLKPNEIGTLEPGKWADFVVLNKDYFTVPEEDIPNVYPLMTVLGGRPTFIRAEFAGEQTLSPIGAQIKFSNVPKGDPASAL